MAMPMYVWSDAPFFLAVAQASSVDEARARMLEEIGEGDGSCPIRDKAREHVKANNPSIWRGTNAEFCLSDSAECIELGALIETQLEQILELKHSAGK